MPSLPADLDQWIKEHLFDVVPMAIAVIDREYNLVHANAAFEQMFGAWQGRKCYSVYKDRETTCPVCRGRRVFDDGVALVNEEIGYNKDGRLTRYVQHTLPIKGENGAVRFLVEISTDITEVERIRQENQLLFEQVPCHILVIDRDFRIVRTNRKVREIFGDIEGKHCFSALKGHAAKCLECTAHQTFVDGGVHTGAHIWCLKEDQTAAMQVTTVPLRQADDSFNLVMEMAVDVTKLLQLEQEKLEAERLAAVGQTVAGLAHGIKNLINALEGGMYLLKSGIQQNRTDRISTGLDMLIRNIERVALFVREFLSFSKGRVIRVQAVDPSKIVEEVVALYAPDAEKHGIILRSEIIAGLRTAPLDFESMHECLTNLVGNAMDACNLSESKDGLFVTVRAFETDDVLVFEVADNGCGMDYEVKQKVFTNFFTTKGLGGTGLGLLTTKKIIQEHGGTIEFESEPGKGSVFRIRLPRKRLPRPGTPAG